MTSQVLQCVIILVVIASVTPPADSFFLHSFLRAWEDYYWGQAFEKWIGPALNLLRGPTQIVKFALVKATPGLGTSIFGERFDRFVLQAADRILTTLVNVIVEVIRTCIEIIYNIIAYVIEATIAVIRGVIQFILQQIDLPALVGLKRSFPSGLLESLLLHTRALQVAGLSIVGF